MFFYSPFLELYRKYETHVHDFLIQGAFYMITAILDRYVAAVTEKNVPTVSLLILFFCFLVTRGVLKANGWQKYFGGFANYGPFYAAFLAFFSWFAYLIMIRWRMHL